LKLVFDTNIFISAFAIPGRRAEEAYRHALRGSFDLCTSVAILTETAQKLREKFGWEEPQVVRMLKAISRVARVVKTKPHLVVLHDEPDNRILECAVETEAEVIVTGDNHLLTLRTFQNVSIVRLADFLKLIQSRD
jgi:putative PIN family toxin of toxin-antitoxin system